MIHRRHLLVSLASLGFGTLTWRRALAAQVAANGDVTPEMIREAEWIAGLELTDEQREETAKSLKRSLGDFRALRKVELTYDVPPAMRFATTHEPSGRPARRNQATPRETRAPLVPASDDDLAFLPITELSALLRERRVTSRRLAELYLRRLKQYDPLLKCVVTLTDKLALEQADRADRELDAGRYRGPLHGVPWGAKDLIAVPGYPTTWGATPLKEQTLDHTATVAAHLEEAGAVLVAKLSLGALAQGDDWMGKKTRNPWDPERGSSGSSAGSASAASAGLVAFAIGSETLGSIISPCQECGVTGLRPTFGRVSRYGCMTLSWSMDKLGPITRSVEDAALVLDAIHGADPRDPCAVGEPFEWPPSRGLAGLRVGYFKDDDTPDDERDDLQTLRELGVTLVPIELPESPPAWPVTLMLGVEATVAFDHFTREGIEEDLYLWPATFRRHQFTPAVEYLRAARLRTLLMRKMDELMRTVDLYIGGDDLPLTNLTGHPSVVLPDGWRRRRDEDRPRRPDWVKFTGRLYDESTLLAVADAFQRRRGFHLERPPVEH